jgi:hypothetical protein
MADAGMPTIYYARPDRLTAFVHRWTARAPRWFAPVAVLFCIATGIAYTIFTNPAGAGAFSNPNCVLKLTTGFDCPGCGGTRAAYYLLHGDVAAAARHHIMFVFAVPFLVYGYLSWSSEKIIGRRVLPKLTVSPLAMTMFMAAWAVFSVARNLPWAPFTALYV